LTHFYDPRHEHLAIKACHPPSNLGDFNPLSSILTRQPCKLAATSRQVLVIFRIGYALLFKLGGKYTDFYSDVILESSKEPHDA
jgi:hypothetical protein